MALLRSSFLIFVVTAAVYVGTLGPERALTPTPDGHFVHLANSYLHGQLHVLGTRPPSYNDWARYGDRWYVSFPPFPALLIMPAVALFGVQVWDRLFWAAFAGLGPAALWLLLRRLVALGRSLRTPAEDLFLTGLFAFGSVYYFSAVQGSVWFAAHVVASVLLCLYLLAALSVRHPFWAGLCLGLAFMTRPTTLLLGGIFLVELVRSERERTAPRLRRVAVQLSLFSAPLLLVAGVAMALNEARFDDPFVFGHQYLMIRWRPRIERYGLFNYHYLARNLGVFLSSLPWRLPEPPYVRISRHGLALWFTTPVLMLLLWPQREKVWYRAVAACAAAVALLDLCYQNSGWIQFGYRFALDYMVVLIALLSVGGHRFGKRAVAAGVFAVAVNTFGALTFDRVSRYYDTDLTQRILYQPD